uniref:phage tail tip fiber protein n=1 Tax=Escherichia coli TaxID=562 RepID=UPI0005A98A9B
QVETTARYLGTGLYWIAASINIKPGHDYYFYIRSVNTVGKSAFVEAVGRASDDAEGYLDFFKGKITESHLGKELLEKVDLTEDNASRLDEFSKEWKDANDKWNAMWGVKIEQTKDGKHYVAGIGLSMEDTEEGKLSQFLVAANRIAFIDPANGNETPMFVAQGNQIFMNDVFLKRLAPLQDAADLEIATEEEISLLEAWKKYRVLLNRVDTSTAQDIEWPALP